MNLINVIRETKGFGCNGFFGWDINGTRVNADYPFRDISFSYGKLYMWLRGTLWSHSASVHYHNERGIEPTIDITAPFRFDKKELLSQLNSELKECLKDPEWDFKNE